MYIIVIIKKGERKMRALICDGGVCRGDQTAVLPEIQTRLGGQLQSHTGLPASHVVSVL